MQIEAKFESCDAIPSILELIDNSGTTQNIQWDDDCLVMNEDNFVISEAYFLGTASEEYDNETEYLYQNIKTISNDWMQNIVYSEIIFRDGAGEVKAIFSDNEEDPMSPIVTLDASWERNSDNEKHQEEEKEEEKEEKITNDVIYSSSYTLPKIDGVTPNVVKNAEPINVENDYTYNGKQYYGLKTIAALSESPSSKERLDKSIAHFKNVQANMKQKVKHKEQSYAR